MSVVSFKLHLLHAPMFFSLVPLIYLIERKCLNFEKTRMIFMGFTLLNVKGLAKSCFFFGPLNVKTLSVQHENRVAFGIQYIRTRHLFKHDNFEGQSH